MKIIQMLRVINYSSARVKNCKLMWESHWATFRKVVFQHPIWKKKLSKFSKVIFRHFRGEKKQIRQFTIKPNKYSSDLPQEHTHRFPPAPQWDTDQLPENTLRIPWAVRGWGCYTPSKSGAERHVFVFVSSLLLMLMFMLMLLLLLLLLLLLSFLLSSLLSLSFWSSMVLLLLVVLVVVIVVLLRWLWLLLLLFS